MAELADAADSKSAGLRPLGVRFPLPAPAFNQLQPKWSTRGPNAPETPINRPFHSPPAAFFSICTTLPCASRLADITAAPYLSMVVTMDAQAVLLLSDGGHGLVQPGAIWVAPAAIPVRQTCALQTLALWPCDRWDSGEVHWSVCDTYTAPTSFRLRSPRQTGTYP